MRISLIGRRLGKMDERYKGQMFLEHANEAATKIRKTNEVISGNNNIPECGTLLGDTYYCGYD